MKYVILITPEDKIEVKEYINYHTLNDLVEGYFERCGSIGILDRMCMVFCNEEFLLQDNYAFNAIGTAIASQPIYGNIVICEDGYNEENERDAIPFEQGTTQAIYTTLLQMKEAISPTLEKLKQKYYDEKPKPVYKIFPVSEEVLEVEDETDN